MKNIRTIVIDQLYNLVAGILYAVSICYFAKNVYSKVEKLITLCILVMIVSFYATLIGVGGPDWGAFGSGLIGFKIPEFTRRMENRPDRTIVPFHSLARFTVDDDSSPVPDRSLLRRDTRQNRKRIGGSLRFHAVIDRQSEEIFLLWRGFRNAAGEVPPIPFA